MSHYLEEMGHRATFHWDTMATQPVAATNKMVYKELYSTIESLVARPARTTMLVVALPLIAIALYGVSLTQP